MVQWTRDFRLENVRVTQVGRNPLVLEDSYRFAVENCWFDGSWNKSSPGYGDLAITRSYEGAMRNLVVRGLRQISFGWSSAQNRIDNLTSSVGIRFDGGFCQGNRVENVEFHLPPDYPLPMVSHANPADSGPPEGPGNVVIEKLAEAKNPEPLASMEGGPPGPPVESVR